MKRNSQIFDEMFYHLETGLLSKWYPLVIDNELGGYYSNVLHNWEIDEKQDKMIVTQSRHIWTLAKAAELFNNEKFKEYAVHGFYFLEDHMWDNKYGGFYQIRNDEGKLSEAEKWFDEKRVYGNAFAIYGLSALYKITKSQSILELAKETFNWIEKNAHDDLNKGYFQFLTRDGKPFGQNTDYTTNATDACEAGYKDQNSSIHLLEAFTELYKVWPNDLLKKRLHEMLFLIRDKITNNKGYLNLFFNDDWTPISFRNASETDRERNYRLDHVSFGHDYETAFLMLEASYELGIEGDSKTLLTCKKMIDHAIENGWDNNTGGFFDEGYYYKNENNCTIIKDTKTWWQQAEGLNALLLFSKIFPNEKKYHEHFIELYNYVNTFLIDKKNNGWFWGSIEKEPFMENEPKGSIWKAAYHDGRSLMNCLAMLGNSNINYKNNLNNKISETNCFIKHWQKVAQEVR